AAAQVANQTGNGGEFQNELRCGVRSRMAINSNPLRIVAIIPTADGLADDWAAALVTTCLLMLMSATVAAVVGVLSAWAAAVLRDARHDRMVQLWVSAMLLTVALPLILHAAAWEATAGKFGWARQTATGGNLGWVAWIHGCHGTAIIALATFWATGRIETATLRHAQLDGAPTWVWWSVRIPRSRTSIAASVLAVMLCAATEMSVADLHSVRTIADQFYLFHAAAPSATSIMVTTLVPIVLGLPLLWIRWSMVTHHGIGKTSHGDAYSPIQGRAAVPLVPRTSIALATLMASLSIIVVLVAPMIGLVLKAGHSVAIVESQRRIVWSLGQAVTSIMEAVSVFASEYGWTLLLATLTTFLWLPASWLLACWCTRRRRAAWMMDCAALVLFLIPGPVVGLFWTKVFSGDQLGLTFLATQTLVPSMLASGLRGAIVAYAILRIGFDSIPQAAQRHGQLDGNRVWRLVHVHLPLTLSHLVLAAVAMMVVVSGDVPAVLPVLPPGVTTVGTRLFGLLHSGARYQEASLAFWYLAGMMVLAWSGRVIARRADPYLLANRSTIG
ncbi:MAG: hypothetical protein AAGC97_19015, partial [Planctomycetota bacterium]